MTELVTLRPATDADRPFLLQVYASTRTAELASVAWTDEQKAVFLAQQFQAQDHHYRAQYAGAEFLVMERGGARIGRLYLHRSDSEIRVMDIALLPEHRRQGIGEALLRDVLQEARQSGRAVGIHVEKDNLARRLYDRLGFREEADRGIYWFMLWTPE